jgi:hypothetical protein
VPTKAAYLALENDSELEAEFVVAHELHMTVQQLREDMTHNEFVHWVMYFNRKVQKEELVSMRNGKR